MRLVLLGAPGSGKGTQAKKLMADKNIPQVSTGDMLREAIAARTRFGIKAKPLMEAGNLVPDEIVLGIISERLSRPDAQDGFILDGFPRTTQQAVDLEELLDQMGTPLDTAVLLDVDFDILLKRLTGRRTCSLTGKLLNIYFSSQEELDACTKAGGELIQRKDDNEETISNRIEVYHMNTEPVIEFYKKRNRLTAIDANGEVDAIYEQLKSALSGNSLEQAEQVIPD